MQRVSAMERKRGMNSSLPIVFKRDGSSKREMETGMLEGSRFT